MIFLICVLLSLFFMFCNLEAVIHWIDFCKQLCAFILQKEYNEIVVGLCYKLLMKLYYYIHLEYSKTFSSHMGLEPEPVCCVTFHCLVLHLKKLH